MPRISDINDSEIIEPEEVPEARGFYYFPEDKGIAVNRFGSVYSPVKNNVFTPTTFWKYEARSYDKEGKILAKYPIAYVMARTFVGRQKRHIEKPHSELRINFIDTFNNHIRPENLEWVSTGQEQSIKKKHPVPTKDTPILAFNLKTKGISRWNNASHAGRFFGIPSGWLFRDLRLGRFRFYHHNGFVYKFDDGTDWDFKEEDLLPYPWDKIKTSFSVYDAENNHTIFCDLDQIENVLNTSFDEFKKTRGNKKKEGFHFGKYYVQQISGFSEQRDFQEANKHQGHGYNRWGTRQK